VAGDFPDRIGEISTAKGSADGLSVEKDRVFGDTCTYKRSFSTATQQPGEIDLGQLCHLVFISAPPDILVGIFQASLEQVGLLRILVLQQQTQFPGPYPT
jgi:hypothetical protein